MKQKTCVNIFVHKIKPENLEKKSIMFSWFSNLLEKKKKLKKKRIGRDHKNCENRFRADPVKAPSKDKPWPLIRCKKVAWHWPRHTSQSVHNYTTVFDFASSGKCYRQQSYSHSGCNTLQRLNNQRDWQSEFKNFEFFFFD